MNDNWLDIYEARLAACSDPVRNMIILMDNPSRRGDWKEDHPGYVELVVFKASSNLFNTHPLIRNKSFDDYLDQMDQPPGDQMRWFIQAYMEMMWVRNVRQTSIFNLDVACRAEKAWYMMMGSCLWFSDQVSESMRND